MHKSKVKPILKLVCKGDAFTPAPKILVRGFTNLKGPHTCLIDLRSIQAKLGSGFYLYDRIGVPRLPMDIKEKSSISQEVRDQCILYTSPSIFLHKNNLIKQRSVPLEVFSFFKGKEVNYPAVAPF